IILTISEPARQTFTLRRRSHSYPLWWYDILFLERSKPMTHHFRALAPFLVNGLLLVTATLLLSTAAFAQTTRRAPIAAPDESPMFQEYRGVQIGWLADDVRKKLGNPADKGDEQDFYVFGEKETAQILYDKATHKVT